MLMSRCVHADPLLVDVARCVCPGVRICPPTAQVPPEKAIVLTQPTLCAAVRVHPVPAADVEMRRLEVEPLLPYPPAIHLVLPHAMASVILSLLSEEK